MRRSAVDLALSVVAQAPTLAFLLGLTEDEYQRYAVLGLVDQARQLEHFAPALSWIGTWGTLAWLWSDALFVLFNAKRRAIHDFIAGTVVVHSDSLPAPVDATAAGA
jgi:hypothetical protein